ncbi:MAG: AzlD domain-containing protein [Clostridiaceae bacterium]
MNSVFLLILGMTVVTYIPRLIPFLMISDRKLPKAVDRFLTFIPYTALGALIIPGVFSAIPQKPLASTLGIGFAIIYSWKKGGIIIPILGSIVVSLTLLLIY